MLEFAIRISSYKKLFLINTDSGLPEILRNSFRTWNFVHIISLPSNGNIADNDDDEDDDDLPEAFSPVRKSAGKISYLATSS